jgi:hypothetical protein
MRRILAAFALLAAARCLEGADTRGARPLTVCGPPPPLAIMNAPTVVGAGSPNHLASVADITGAGYSWTITNGTITSGQGTARVLFTGGTAGVLLHLQVDITQNGCPFGGGFADVTVAPSGQAVQFYTTAPCRLVDTRGADAPSLDVSGSPDRAFALGGLCGLPADATAVSANVTVVAGAGAGQLAIYPGDGTVPGTTTIAFSAGQTRANNAIVPLASDGSGTVKVNNSSAGFVQLILDVTGYFR